MKNIILIFGFVMYGLRTQSQDLHFSQFYETPIWRNPALAGIFTGQYRFQTVYRNQWQSIRGTNNSPNPFRTMGAGGEFKFKGYCMDDKSSFVGGFQVMRDQAGDSRFRRTITLLSLTYRKLILNNVNASVGFCGGPVISTFDPSGLQWDDQFQNYQYSPTNPTNQVMPNNTKNYFDMGVGLAFNGGAEEATQWYAGVGAYHLHQPEVAFDAGNGSLSKLRPRMTYNGGLVFIANETDRLKVYVDVMTQNRQSEMIFGVIYKKALLDENGVEDDGVHLSFGALYRFTDALIPVINLQWNQWTAGFSYDANVSKLTKASSGAGGLEFTLKLRGLSTAKRDACTRYGCNFD